MPNVKFSDSQKFTTNHIIFVFVTKVSNIFSDGKPASDKGGDSRKSSESSSKHDAGNKAMSSHFIFLFNMVFSFVQLQLIFKLQITLTF